MELIIILLIAVEVVIVSISPSCKSNRAESDRRFLSQCLIRDGPELLHMIKDDKSTETTAEPEK